MKGKMKINFIQAIVIFLTQCEIDVIDMDSSKESF